MDHDPDLHDPSATWRWQNECEKGSKGRYLLNNKPLVGSAGSSGRNRKEERVMTRLRNG